MIICVEDDSSIRELMLYALKTSGYNAEGYSCGADFWAAVRQQRVRNPELILLDIMLPDEDGVTILKKLKEMPEFVQVPVIMASAKGTEFDKVVGLDSGADDYLVKPFGMMELVSRVRAVLRRAGVSQAEPAAAARAEVQEADQKKELKRICVGGLELIPEAHRVLVCGEEINLTLKEYELLKLFMEHVGIAFTRDNLFEMIWGTDFTGESRTVDVHIGTLRSKLGSCGARIRTVRGVGYRMEE